MPAGIVVVSVAIPQSSQWVNVPEGASGSSTTRASDPTSSGTFEMSSFGDRSAPSQVCFFGIDAPSANAGVLKSTELMVLVVVVVVVGSSAVPPNIPRQPPSPAVPPSASPAPARTNARLPSILRKLDPPAIRGCSRADSTIVKPARHVASPMPRRSVLFTPGDRPEMLRKAPDAGADVIVF